MRRTPKVVSVLLISLFPFLLGRCSPDEAQGPPEIHSGRDVCAECGMIINQTRFAAAMVVQVNGAPEPRVFDDIGDMLDYEHHHPELPVLARYIRTYDSDHWTQANSARFLLSEGVTTPMASGIIAFDTPANCDAAKAKLGGREMTFVEANEVRAASRKN